MAVRANQQMVLRLLSNGVVSIAQARMAGLPPEQRQYFMQQQQLVIAQMQQQV